VRFSQEEVLGFLPHRPPFLLVDEVVDGEPGVRCVAVRTLRDDDYWFAGHFPGNPVMPGVLIVEALAQTATIAAAAGGTGDAAAEGGAAEAAPATAAGPADGKVGLFAGIDKVRFKRVCRPGDTLRLEAEIIAVHGPVGRAKVKATVDGQLACRGELMFAIVDAAAVAAGGAKL
jgi:3-hydroxyacyl-[acyl-carrier-protein] dehydratase